MGNTIKKLISALLVGMLSLSLIGLGACSAPEPEPEPEPVADEMRVIGKETDTAYAIEVTNDSGKSIISFAVKLASDAEYQKSLVTTSTQIAAGETVLMYIEPLNAAVPEGETATAGESDNESAATAGSVDEAANDVVLRDLYDIALTFDDETKAELHDLNLEGFVAFAICLTDDGIAYIEYTNDDGKTESTLETEKALKLAEEEAAAQAQAQAEAEAAAAAQAEADAAAAAAAAQNNNSGYSYDTGTGSTGGTQGEDACVDDLIFN